MLFQVCRVHIAKTFILGPTATTGLDLADAIITAQEQALRKYKCKIPAIYLKIAKATKTLTANVW